MLDGDDGGIWCVLAPRNVLGKQIGIFFLAKISLNMMLRLGPVGLHLLNS